jgi:hypothetical protein
LIPAAGWRGALARVLLLILAWADLPSAAVRETPARLSSAVSATGSQTVFWFDPGYAAFLDAVRRETPGHATVSLVVPQTTDLYVYRAVYGLVPRRVVGPAEWASSDYVAVYGGRVALPIPAGRPVPGGTLLRR